MGTSTFSMLMTLDPFSQRRPSEAHEPNARIVDLGPPGSALDRHPYCRWHLQRQFVVLERRDQADHPLGNQNSRFGKRMGSLNLGVRELVEAARRADDRFLSDETGERFRSNALGNEFLQPKHSPGLQEIERAKSLGVGGCHAR